jgi:hypothetical protein
MAKVGTITVDALNLPIVRRMVETLESIAGLPDDANAWDASDLAKEVLDEVRQATR